MSLTARAGARVALRRDGAGDLVADIEGVPFERLAVALASMAKAVRTPPKPATAGTRPRSSRATKKASARKPAR
ncbi:MAG: hypothetical protein IT379_35610 [Deltaproteobacteria bacterium]|nr:hypothetical protein [Deltaproteobacteria bacterium]